MVIADDLGSHTYRLKKLRFVEINITSDSSDEFERYNNFKELFISLQLLVFCVYQRFRLFRLIIFPHVKLWLLTSGHIYSAGK